MNKKKKSAYQIYRQSIKKKNKKKPDKASQIQLIKQVQSTKKINRNKMKPGMICKFNYRGIRNIDPDPFVLVLNDNFRGKTHGIALRNLSVRQIKILIDIVKNKGTKNNVFSRFKSIFSKQQTEQVRIQNPRKFYYSAIKPFLKSTEVNCYRTYFSSRITNIRHISYKFQKDIGMQLAVQKQRVVTDFKRASDKEFYTTMQKTGKSKQFKSNKYNKNLKSDLKALKDAGWI